MYYFASDMHLGLGEPVAARRREKLFVEWLEKASVDAEAIFIVGDMFDFWYEYRRLVPKGFTRLLGTLSALTDRGVRIHFFPGNHDMWAYDYLKEECGVEVHHQALVTELYGKRVYIAHGDDITAQDSFWTRRMNAMFRSRVTRWMFSHILHPNTALRFGQRWSAHSRKSKEVAHTFLAEDESMVRFARKYNASQPIDYFIFGHNHCAEIYPLDDRSTAVFLGEWIDNPTYATMQATGEITLHKAG